MLKLSRLTRGGQRYIFGGELSAGLLPFFLRPLALALVCCHFKFASALCAIPLQPKLPLCAIPYAVQLYKNPWLFVLLTQIIE